MPGAILQHSPADVVGRLLADLGVGTNPESDGVWPIYDGVEPDKPDNLITVYDTKGRRYGRVQFSGEGIEAPGITFRIRSAKPRDGFLKASEISKVISEIITFNNVSIVSPESGGAIISYEVAAITQIGTILNLGRYAPTLPGVTASSSKRNIYVLNAVVSLRQL